MARQTHTDERGSVHGVNPGTELGRYTIGTRIEKIPGGERWTARDTTLDRDVTLLVMPSDALSTTAGLDAARRAAGVEAPQLVRILDVGTEGDLAFIAEDNLPGAKTYTEVIGADGLPAEEVRRITGEVATGLEAARARGLHHLVLTPDLVLLTSDGRIKLRGLATVAALSGIETEGEDADREDAAGVVALAYAGLTGTWPLDQASGLPAAPRDSHGPPAPSRVAVGVPGDLDTICRETLLEGTGPDSPGDYAAQIAPWSRIPLAGAAQTTPMTALTATDLSEQGLPATEDEPTEVLPTSAQATTAIPQRAATASAPSSAGSIDPADEETREIDLRATAEPEGTQGTPAPDTGDAPQETTGRAAPAPAGSASGSAAATAAKATAAAASVGGAVGASSKALGERLGKVAKTAGERSKEALEEARARREAIRADQHSRTSLGSAPVSVDLEPPAPLLPAEAGGPPSRRQANLVLVIMAAFVAVACLIGGIGTSRIGSGSELGKILGGDATTAVATSESSGQGSSTSDGGDEPVAILNAAGFDPPPGDGVEHNAEIQRIYDGDPSTAWTTEGYNSESFGGVKQGVGVAVDLGQQQDITSVTLDLPTAAQATVFAGDQATNSGTEIGKTEGRSGQVVLEPSSPVTAQYVTVWFTTLVPGQDGRYRAALGEITIR